MKISIWKALTHLEILSFLSGHSKKNLWFLEPFFDNHVLYFQTEILQVEHIKAEILQLLLNVSKIPRGN